MPPLRAYIKDMKTAEPSSADNERAVYTLLGQVTAYCEQVNAGAKPCAQMLCLKKYLPFVEKNVKQEKCMIMYKDVPADVVAIFIYKYDFVKPIIEELLIDRDEGTPSAFQIWATGKLFGYSDYEISQYLKAHGYLSKR